MRVFTECENVKDVAMMLRKINAAKPSQEFWP